MATETPDKRTEVRRESARLFRYQGFSGTSMDELANAVSLTKGSLYHYVGSKSDLLYEIYKSVLDAMDERVQRQDATLSASERVTLHLRDMIEVAAAMPDESAVYLQESPFLTKNLPPRQARELAALEQNLTDHISDIVHEAIEDGTFVRCDPKVAALTVIGVAAWASRWLRADGSLTVRGVADTISSLILNGLAEPTEAISASTKRPGRAPKRATA